MFLTGALRRCGPLVAVTADRPVPGLAKLRLNPFQGENKPGATASKNSTVPPFNPARNSFVIRGVNTERRETEPSNRLLSSKDLLALAAANQAPAGTRAYTTTANPTFAKTYSTMQTLGANGTVKNNQSANDYNTLTTSYQPTGNDQRNFYTARLDYNVTSKHTLSFVYNYDKYVSIPNFLNGSADLPRLGYGALFHRKHRPASGDGVLAPIGCSGAELRSGRRVENAYRRAGNGCAGWIGHQTGHGSYVYLSKCDGRCKQQGRKNTIHIWSYPLARLR